MKSDVNKRNTIAITVAIISCLFILMFLKLALYAQPAVDDFDFAYRARTEGFFASQWSWYINWTGRYSSTALITSFVNRLDLFNDYWLIPTALIAGTTVAFCVLIYVVAKEKIKLGHAVCGGLLLSAVYLDGVPSPAETFYWLSGGVTYQAGNIMFMLLIVSAVTIFNDHATQVCKNFSTVFSVLLIVMISGMNETIMVLQLLFVVFMFAKFSGNEPQKRGVLLSLFLLSVASSSVVLLAPGNVERSKCFTQNNHLAISLWNSVKTCFLFSAQWSLSPCLILATVIAVPVVVSFVKEINPNWNPNAKDLMLCIILWLIMATLYFPAFWSMGIPPPLRTFSTIYLVFMCWWFFTATVVCLRIMRSQENFPFAVCMFFCCVLPMSFLFSGNGAIAYEDLGKGENYLAELHRRHATIECAKDQGIQNILVPLVKDPPSTILVTDITGDPRNWRNVPYSRYFSVKSVATSVNLHQNE